MPIVGKRGGAVRKDLDTSNNARWKQRYRAARIAWARIALGAP
jgi:hypothetical protein